MDIELGMVLSELNFSCLCCLVENPELRKLGVSVDYCTKLKFLLGVDSMAVKPSSLLVQCLNKQIVLSLFIF